MIDVNLDRSENPETGRRYVNMRLTDTRPDGRTFRVSIRAQDIDGVIAEMVRLAPALKAAQEEILTEVSARQQMRDRRRDPVVPAVEVRPLRRPGT